MSTSLYTTLNDDVQASNNAASAATATATATAKGNTTLGGSSEDLPSTLQRISLSSSINHSQSQQASPEYTVLKIRNIPNDITLREAILIFSLCLDDVHYVDIKQESIQNALCPVIFAKFYSPKTATQVFQLLNNKQLFGTVYSSVICELTHELSNPHRSSSLADLSASDMLASFANYNQRSRFAFNEPFPSSQNQKLPLSQDNSSPTNSSPPKNVNISSLDNSHNNNNNNNNNNYISSHASNDLSHQSLRGFSNSQRLPAIDQFQQSNGNTWSSTGNNQSASLSSKVMRPENLNLSGTANNIGSGLSTPLTDWSQNHFFNTTPTLLINENSKSSPPQQQQKDQQTSPATLRLQSSANSKNEVSQQPAIPELSLLARVPPPANPADQNPPCNTLYVGNLPPDATEMELRALFQPQAGFRRLSFRTKQNTNGASHHGPMCFVEFEDVAHATRALAELYGRQLVRINGSSISNKGGIRLSFSKNPLGVRGPSHQRRNNTTANPLGNINASNTSHALNDSNTTANNAATASSIMSSSSAATSSSVQGNNSSNKTTNGNLGLSNNPNGYGYLNAYQFHQSVTNK